MSPVDRAGMDGSHQQRNDLLDNGLEKQQEERAQIREAYTHSKYMYVYILDIYAVIL